jgi:hypothetical protein
MHYFQPIKFFNKEMAGYSLRTWIHTLLCVLFILVGTKGIAQPKQNLIYVDKKGVIRFTSTKKEASFFGVNYTVPFAYGYRSHQALGKDLEKAIDADVYHMARLGLDAFRVHMWDVELSDSLGNLQNNEHLRLFDYLVQKLKERNIRILLTPIAFWGNGYPEKDEKTNGFSSVYGKQNAVVQEVAIKAQENYIRQLFTHVNPYTKLAYKDDPNIIAVEINNEPHHSGLRERTTEYINRLSAALKSTGWTKPVFYNISESPNYAGAVVNAKVDGHSFQWYPTGLVAGHEQKGNYLPNVDQYYIPFADSLPAFKNRAKMVYEFDAADILQSNMYPAMARSFRTAGFQWATQFAYDPMATAYANTEYQTHYLNLAYTPSKAISLFIASKAFHILSRVKSYGSYPADTLFGQFRVSYRNQLSEMNTASEYYYSNTTNTKPVSTEKLQHIAGVGSSPVVHYDGTGAYFLDRLQNGNWRLEIMPDALTVLDPFEKASPKKEVVKISWKGQGLQLYLPGMMDDSYHLVEVNSGKEIIKTGKDFFVSPGVYIVCKKIVSTLLTGVSKEFHAPPSSVTTPLLIHQPLEEVTAGKSFTINANIVGIDPEKVSLELRNTANQWKTINFDHVAGYMYSAIIPVEMVTPGVLNYRIMVHGNGSIYTFPGATLGEPYAWDNVASESWQTFVSPAKTPLLLFDATSDRQRTNIYNNDWRNNKVALVPGAEPRQLALQTTLGSSNQLMGWQFYFGDKIDGRREELSSFTKLVVKARSPQEIPFTISLITMDAQAFSASMKAGKEFTEIEIPLSLFKEDSMLLLPRPFPGFQPLWYKASSRKSFDSMNIEKLEVRFTRDGINSDPATLEIASVWLQ